MRLFVDLSGQDDNVGDTALRREFLAALRNHGCEIHVHASENSPSYRAGLRLEPTDVQYGTRREWTVALAAAAVRGDASLALNPGEARADRMVNYANPRVRLAARMVGFGGVVIHSGIGLRASDGPRGRGLQSLVRMADIVTWRDWESARRAGTGEVRPDWAFASQASGQHAERKFLAITMRGDRRAPSIDWFRSVQRLAKTLGARPAAFSQVVRDNEQTLAIAERLGGDVHVDLWRAGDHFARETELRRLFARSHAVVSDRVHALILGATEGANPIGLTDQNPEKIERTLAGAGFEGRGLRPDPSARDSFQSALRAAPAVQEVVRRARAQLTAHASELATLLERASG